MHEKKHQLSKYDDNTNSLLKRNILCTNPGLTMRFLISVTVLTIKTDKQSNLLRAKGRWVLRGFQDKPTDHSPGSTRPGFRISCQMAASKGWDLVHIDLKTAFLQGQSYHVNRESHLLLFDNFSKQYFNKCVTLRLMSLREMPMLQHTIITKQVPRSVQFFSHRHAERDATRSQYGTLHLEASFTYFYQ